MFLNSHLTRLFHLIDWNLDVRILSQSSKAICTSVQECWVLLYEFNFFCFLIYSSLPRQKWQFTTWNVTSIHGNVTWQKTVYLNMGNVVYIQIWKVALPENHHNCLICISEWSCHKKCTAACQRILIQLFPSTFPATRRTRGATPPKHRGGTSKGNRAFKAQVIRDKSSPSAKKRRRGWETSIPTYLPYCFTVEERGEDVSLCDVSVG